MCFKRKKPVESPREEIKVTWGSEMSNDDFIFKLKKVIGFEKNGGVYLKVNNIFLWFTDDETKK